MPSNPDLKKRKCNGFWGRGSCCYGVRCQFGHHIDGSQDKWTLKQAYELIKTPGYDTSRLMRMLADL